MSFRVLLVGLGNRGRVWGRVVAEDADADLVGVVDLDPGRVAASEGSPGFADLSVAIEATRPDAVLLVTPPEGHLGQARVVLAAGVPLLCEKPLTLDLAEAVEIVEMFERGGVPLGVGLNFRYLPVSRALKAFLAAGTFGAPGFGSFAYRRRRDWWRPGMNRYPLTMRHPMMLEQAIHHLDLIRHCYGAEVLSVSCRSWNPLWSAYAEDANVSCLLSLEGGLEVDYTGTWTGGWNELQFEWRTDCPDGVIVQRELFSDLATARTEDAALTAMPLEPCVPFLDDTRALFRAFRCAVQSGAPAPCSGRDHLRTLALCFAAIEADAAGRRVDVAEFERLHRVRS